MRGAPTREELEAAIENAIDALNALDGEPDFEPEETDHSASEDDFDRMPFSPNRELLFDDEPSLGSLNCVGTFVDKHAHPHWGTYSQVNWSGGGDDDREQDAGDEREAEADCEGWDQVPHAGVGVIAYNGEWLDEWWSQGERVKR